LWALPDELLERPGEVPDNLLPPRSATSERSWASQSRKKTTSALGGAAEGAVDGVGAAEASGELLRVVGSRSFNALIAGGSHARDATR
jgi:hypothetical protein